MCTRRFIAPIIALVAAMLGGFLVMAQNPPMPADHERTIKEAEVPKAALDALKKLAGNAAITEFAEEIEHGHTFYEGSWKGPNGNIDAVVTAAGDLVVIEEVIPAGQAPAAVRDQAQKAAGKDGKLTLEKKTMVLYEVHFHKDGKAQEIVFTPDARIFHEDGNERQADDRDDE